MMRQNRDLEDFFRRVQMTLNNRGGGGGGRFETSQRTTAPATGTTAPVNGGMERFPSTDIGTGQPGVRMMPAQPGYEPRYKSPRIQPQKPPGGGYPSPAPRIGQPPSYTSPGFPSPAPRIPKQPLPPGAVPQPRPGQLGPDGRPIYANPPTWTDENGQVHPNYQYYTQGGF